MTDLSIVISADQNWEQVKILIEIFRENFRGNFFFIVCTPFVAAQTFLSDCPIDELLITKDIPKDQHPLTDEQFRTYNRMKIVDSIRKGCQHASLSTSPYTLHLRVGSYPLNWLKIQSLLNKMQDEKLAFAARGYGFGFYTHDSPLGRLDDNFFFFDNEYARRVGLWDFDLVDFLPHKVSAQGMLAMLVLSRIGLRRFYHYSEMSQEMGDSFFYFDSKYDFLYLDKSGPSKTLKQRLMAYYLRQFDLKVGRHIQLLLDRWAADKPEQLKLNVWVKTAWLWCQCAISLRTGMRSVKDRLLMKRPHYVTYRDTIWPQSLDRYYRQTLKFDSLALKELEDLVLDTERL